MEIKRFALVLTLLLFTVHQTQGQEKRNWFNFRHLVGDYAKAMVENDYGRIDALFPTMIDRETMFLNDTLPLPNVFSRGFSHFEAKTDGPKLMFTLYQLGKQLGN